MRKPVRVNFMQVAEILVQIGVDLFAADLCSAPEERVE